MCALLLKPFVLGYIFLALVLQLLIYFKKLTLVPRAMDTATMLIFLLAIYMSRLLMFRGSILIRLIILGAIYLVLYFISKKVYPNQYKSLLTLKDKEGYKALLTEGESLDEKREVFTLKNPETKEKILAQLAQEKRPVFELIMALILGGIFIYFLVN